MSALFDRPVTIRELERACEATGVPCGALKLSILLGRVDRALAAYMRKEVKALDAVRANLRVAEHASTCVCARCEASHRANRELDRIHERQAHLHKLRQDFDAFVTSNR